MTLRKRAKDALTTIPNFGLEPSFNSAHFQINSALMLDVVESRMLLVGGVCVLTLHVWPASDLLDVVPISLLLSPCALQAACVVVLIVPYPTFANLSSLAGVLQCKLLVGHFLLDPSPLPW